jgi:hypothetical protein
MQSPDQLLVRRLGLPGSGSDRHDGPMVPLSPMCSLFTSPSNRVTILTPWKSIRL